MAAETKALHHHRVNQGTKSTRQPPGTAQLTYYIFEGVLVGFMGTDMIHLTAWSGGAGGSRKLTPTNDANNPYSYGVKEVSGSKHPTRGGPLPPGSYHIHPPATGGSLGLHARLDPLFTAPNHRGGFAIHGQGPKGSDGCIVIPDDRFRPFMDQLKKCGGGHLHVCEAMDSAFA
jgi:hypothetical protein